MLLPSTEGDLSLIIGSSATEYRVVYQEKTNEDGSESQSSDNITRWPSPCRPLSRLHVALLVSSLAIVVVLLCALFIRSSSNLSYDRSLDPSLRQFILTSPAAAALPINGSLFCWVMTAERYHETRARAVNETWISRCDHGEFFTNAPFNDPKVPYRTVFAGIPDTYDNLFYKSRYAFRYIYEEMGNGFDWFMKTDDDTFVIIENLKKYLETLDPSVAYYLGFRLKSYIPSGYNAGGAGYVLSRAALRQLAEVAYFNSSFCPDDIYEDVGIGRCLASLGIFPAKTLNENGQQRFNSFHWLKAFHGFEREEDWLTDLPALKGYGMVARDLVSFHHLSPDEIRLFDILLYRVDVNGRNGR